jgi:hypothetical protein
MTASPVFTEGDAMAATEIQTIKASKRRHVCTWCGEEITVGSSYLRWRGFGEDGNVGTIKMHPECEDAKERAFREGTIDEFFTGEFPRGCDCQPVGPCCDPNCRRITRSTVAPSG